MQIRKLYFLLLLAYEIQLRAGAPSHSITKETKKAKAAKPAKVAKADGPLPAPQVASPLPKASEVPVLAVLGLQKPVAARLASLCHHGAGSDDTAECRSAEREGGDMRLMACITAIIQ